MSAVQFDALKDAVTARLRDLEWAPDTQQITLHCTGCDEEGEKRLWSLLQKAEWEGYALEIRLVTYEGCPDAPTARAKRRKKR